MNIKKLCIGGISAVLMLGLIPIKASSVSPGEGFRVSVSCGNVEGTVAASATNATITSAGNWCNRGESIAVSAVAGSAGTATITITGVDATGNANTANPVDYSGVVIGSSSVNVIAPSTNNNTPTQTQKPSTNETKPEAQKPAKDLSSNANLASLSISQGTLSPKFSASKTQYTVNLNGDVSSLKVNATTADSKASVYGTGTKTLKPGKNTITIRVAAEDGTAKEYTITVNVDETPLVYTDYNGAKLGFVRNLDGVDKPAKSFESVKIKVEGKEVKAWKSNLLKKTVVYLQDDKTKEKNYYIYNTDSNTVESILRPMALLGNNIFIVDVPKNLQNREGMTFTTVKVDKYEVSGWTFKDPAFQNYALLYVMDEKGNMVYYQYESTEKTLQLYSDAAAITQKAYDQYRKDTEALQKRNQMMIYGLAGGCILLACVSAFFIFRKKKTVKYPKKHITGSNRDAEAEALRNITDED